MYILHLPNYATLLPATLPACIVPLRVEVASVTENHEYLENK